MSESPDDIDAALLAAGALAAPEWRAARKRMKSDPAFTAKAAEWEEALAPIALGQLPLLAPLAPPEGLLGKIEARLDARVRLERLAASLREPEGDWIVIGPGLRFKTLERFPEQRRQTILLEAEPGAVYAAHDHDEDEEIYMISGDLSIGDEEELGPGDYHFAKKGGAHPASTTRMGCRCLICKGM